MNEWECWAAVAGEPYCRWQSSLWFHARIGYVTAPPPPSFRFCVVCWGPGESQVTVAEVGTVKELRPQESPVKEVLCWGADPVG